MRKVNTYLLLIIAAITIISCKPSLDKSRQKITTLENELRNSTSALDSTKSKTLIDLYIDFADRFPNDSSADKFVFNAARLSVNISKNAEAIKLLDRVTTVYPQSKFTPECLFLKAYIYDDKLKDYKNADKYYKEFLNKYPTHELAPSAKQSLETLGVPAEALIKIYEQRNAQAKADSIKK